MTLASKLWIGLAVAVGIFAGVGLFTFTYAQGFSYFSDKPETCNNCHIMNDHYSSWQKSSHHAAAVCNDCHMPHDSVINKMITKADNGWRHSKAFTLQNYHQPLMITKRNAEVLQNNCVRCHSSLVHNLVGDNPAEMTQCVKCHSHVGHGVRK